MVSLPFFLLRPNLGILLRRLARRLLVVGDSWADDSLESGASVSKAVCCMSSKHLGARSEVSVGEEEPCSSSMGEFVLPSSVEMVELHSDPTVRLDSGRSGTGLSALFAESSVLLLWLSSVLDTFPWLDLYPSSDTSDPLSQRVSGSVRRPSFPRLRLESLRSGNPVSSFGTCCCSSYGFLNLDMLASSPSLSPSLSSGEGPFDFETLAEAIGGVLPSIRRVDAGE